MKKQKKRSLKGKITALIAAALSFIGLSAYTGYLKPFIELISMYITERFEKNTVLYGGGELSVHDGDTLTLDGQKIRLYGIDAPELAQKYGAASRDKLITLVKEAEKRGDNITVTVIDNDRYGRSVGVLMLGEVNANKAMLAGGSAWYYASYCKRSFCGEWREAAEKAKESKLGLWQEKNPKPPWNFRRE